MNIKPTLPAHVPQWVKTVVMVVARNYASTATVKVWDFYPKVGR